jgi:hypothetical protein
MLTEVQVRTAVANGIHFLNRTREPYGLWFMSMMHRLFGVPEFADALKRYDEQVAARPQEAPVLRVLRRLNDANNLLQPDDWDHVQVHTDRVLAIALYCDRLGFPPEFAETLEKGVKAGGYHATHVLLAWIWSQDNRCKLAVRDGFVEDLYRANAAILEDQPTIVNDLKLEAAAFLCMARQGKRVDPRFIRHVVSIQRADGGWGKLDQADPAKPDESSWHSTILALLLLLHVSFPGT